MARYGWPGKLVHRIREGTAIAASYSLEPRGNSDPGSAARILGGEATAQLLADSHRPAVSIMRETMS